MKTTGKRFPKKLLNGELYGKPLEHWSSLNQQEATFKGHLEEILLEGCSAVSFLACSNTCFCLTVPAAKKMLKKCFLCKINIPEITVMLMNSPVKLT